MARGRCGDRSGQLARGDRGVRHRGRRPDGRRAGAGRGAADDPPEGVPRVPLAADGAGAGRVHDGGRAGDLPQAEHCGDQYPHRRPAVRRGLDECRLLGRADRQAGAVP